MAWFHVDDRFHSHPKAAEAGNAALGAWVLLGSFAADHGMDGYVPARNARAFANQRELRRLVDVRLIDHVDVDAGWPGPGYVVHDYLDCNPSRSRRDSDNDRKRRWRSKRDASRDPDRDAPLQLAPAPAPRSKSELAAAALTLAPPAAAAADLFTAHRVQAEGTAVKSPARYAARIRRDEIAAHLDELVAVDVDADPIDVAVAVFGMTKSDAIRAAVRTTDRAPAARDIARASRVNGEA